VSFGGEGIVAQEIKSCLYGQSQAQVHGYIAGVGGMDITGELLADMARETLSGQIQGHQLGDSIWIKVLS
jgi:pyruvate/2-oxoacid:ferredoxin oxidoreductase alpha subunit